MFGLASLALSGYQAIQARKGAKKSAQYADQRSAMADTASDELVGFAREQYEQWEKIFGPIQENLAEYYGNLSADTIASRGLEAFERERAQAVTQLGETLAQRGIATSGLAAQAETDLAMMSAQERAQIRANAPMEAAKQKLGFLQFGLSQNKAENYQNALGGRLSYLSGGVEPARAMAYNAAQASADATGKFLEQGIDMAAQLAGKIGGGG